MATADLSSLPPGIPVPGDTIDGKYALIRVIGAGGMGVVYEAEHLRLKQRCAIKMLSPEMLREADIVHRFEREARASALLKSPHVTRVTDVATTPQGVPYIVMELLVGQDLDGLLQDRGSIGYPEAVDYVLQGCAAVAEAHAAGIIHRDLKPGNLFLAHEEQGIVVKVLDFGISKMVEEESKLTSAGMTMGTALYMSPEQLRSAAKVDARSDIWSLGIILYELVCGQPPFVGSATQVAAAIVSEDAPDITARCAVPPALGAVIHRALRRAPAERFATVAELAAALAPFAAPESLGRAVAAQISRRGSSRHLPVESERGSSPRISGVVGGGGAFADARTEVSTSVSHEVNTAVRHDSASRQLLIAALAVVGGVAFLGAIAVALVLLRRPSVAPPAAAGSASVAAQVNATPSASVELSPRVEPAPSVAAPADATPASTSGAEAAAAATAAASSVRAPKPHAGGATTAAAPTAGGAAGAGAGHPRPPASATTAAPAPRPPSTATSKATPAFNPPFLN